MRTGRKPKLTPELQEEFIKALRSSWKYKTACDCCQITYSTFCLWMQKGKASAGPYRNFLTAVKKQRAENIRRAVARIQQASKKQWQAAAWLCERDQPEEWGQNSGLITALVKQVGELQAALASVLAAQKTQTENPALTRANGHAPPSLSAN